MRKLVVAAVVACLPFTAISDVEAATPGLAYSEDTVFTVRDDSVLVTTTAVMSNTTTERRSGNTIYYSYFDQFQHVIPRGATDLSVVSRGRSLTTTLQDLDSDFDLASARLPSELRSGQSRTIELSYVLPTGTIRGEGLFFSNAAFHSFPLWSFSDPGTGSLQLRVPLEADFGHFGGALRRVATEEGFAIWEPRDFDVPEEVFSLVTVTLDDALVDQTFEVSGQRIVLRTWPGDDVWATFARDTIEKGLPTLESLVGLPIPDQDSLEITESVTPYFYGYGGWYDPADTSIEVGNELDDSVMLHELSHAWFNDALFDERWLNEGLAEEFTWQAQRTLGWPTDVVPETPAPDHPGALDLLAWNDAFGRSFGGEDVRATEEYGYEASWYTVHELVELIGVEGMRDVLVAVDADIVSYVGDDPAETTEARDDWRRVLDLVTEVGAPADEPLIEQLFIDYVVPADNRDVLDSRRTAREFYRDFVAQQPSWRVPDDLRAAMTSWDFEDATSLMDQASDVLALHREVQEEMQRRNISSSNAARLAYESNTPDFEAASAILDAQLAALPEIDHLRTTFDLPLSTNQRWGIGDVDLAPLVERAEAAYSRDAFDEIAIAQRDMDRVLETAEVAGAERILWTKIGSGAGALLVLALLAGFMRRARRHAYIAANSDLARTDVVLSV